MMMNPNNSMPPPAPADFSTSFAILALIADPVSAKARLEQLAAASAEARSAIDQAAQAQNDLVAATRSHEETITQERAAHDAALATERTLLEVETERRTRDLTAREAAVAALEKQAKVDADAAAKLKANLEDRLKRIQVIAA